VSLLDLFLTQVEAHPERTAIIGRKGNAVSYAELSRGSARLAAALKKRGIGKGERVLVALRPGIALYAGLAAIWRLGAVAVFPEPAMGLAGLRLAARAAQPKAFLAEGWILALSLLLPETRRIANRIASDEIAGGEFTDCAACGPGDPALISFTSGSTGAPKGMIRSHGLLSAQHQALSPLIAPERDNETDLAAFPAFVLTCLGHGATVTLPRWNLRRFDAAGVIRQITEQHITRALLPPVVVAALAGNALPASLRKVLTGGGPLYPDVAQRFLEGTRGTVLTVVYGSTEAEPVSHIGITLADDALWAEISAGGGLPVGLPVPEASVRIVENEIVVAGPHVNCGYLDPARDAETKLRAGDTVWHRTGDAGRFDERGRLWLLGRLKQMAGGLYPFAVESAARLWPGVRGAAFAAENERALLFVAGDEGQLPQWRRAAATIGGIEIVPVARIPMDRRHRSKPDLNVLMRITRRARCLKNEATRHSCCRR
jgi:olefin beta-lactone synthetase